MIYVFVDFEMNMIDSEYKKEKKICKSEIIEIGAVKLDEDYNEIDSFKSYVKPAYGTMASRIIKLTGITDDMVENAPSYAFAMGSFIEWCADADVIYAWSENDLRQLRKEARLKEYTHPGLKVSIKVEGFPEGICQAHRNVKKDITVGRCVLSGRKLSGGRA